MRRECCACRPVLYDLLLFGVRLLRCNHTPSANITAAALSSVKALRTLPALRSWGERAGRGPSKQRVGHRAQVVVGVDAAGQGQPYQFERWAVVLALAVAALRHIAALHRADAGLEDLPQ